MITKFIPPGSTGVRVDTAAYSGWFVPPYYDSLVAKLLTHASTRDEAISRMQRALSMFVIEGIYTSIPLQQRILDDREFRSGQYDTHFIERLLGKKAEAA
jgi:acetyl-CoA carboxylase biotin carboxylase subunit